MIHKKSRLFRARDTSDVLASGYYSVLFESALLPFTTLLVHIVSINTPKRRKSKAFRHLLCFMFPACLLTPKHNFTDVIFLFLTLSSFCFATAKKISLNMLSQYVNLRKIRFFRLFSVTRSVIVISLCILEISAMNKVNSHSLHAAERDFRRMLRYVRVALTQHRRLLRFKRDTRN